MGRNLNKSVGYAKVTRAENRAVTMLIDSREQGRTVLVHATQAGDIEPSMAVATFLRFRSGGQGAPAQLLFEPDADAIQSELDSALAARLKGMSLFGGSDFAPLTNSVDGQRRCIEAYFHESAPARCEQRILIPVSAQ